MGHEGGLLGTGTYYSDGDGGITQDSSGGGSSSGSGDSSDSGSSSSGSSGGGSSGGSSSSSSNSSGSGGSNGSGSDESIGRAGTIPVEPGNPLYDSVKSGGGFVEDRDGNVTGGPDGDGTARTEQERTSGSSGGGGSSGGSSTASSSDPSNGAGTGSAASGGIEARAFEQVQNQTIATLDRQDVEINQQGGDVSAKFTQSGRRKEAVAQRKSELAGDVPGATAEDVVIEEPNQQLINSIESDASFDDIPVRSGGAGTPTKSTQADTGGQSLVEQGREQRDSETGEAFGGRGDVEQGLRDASEDFRETVSEPVADVSGDVGDIVQSGAAVSAAGNPALILSGASDPGDVQAEIEAGPDRVQDIARSPENEQSSERIGERLGEGIGEGASEAANLPQLGVIGIEAGEVGKAGAEAAASGELEQFGTKASAAGAVMASQTAAAASSNPARFAGQLAGGAATGLVTGAGAQSIVRRASSAGRRSNSLSSGSSLQRFVADNRGMADMTSTTKTRTRADTSTDSQTADAPAEADLPPREAFASDEAFARELARARARDDLPPRAEFESQDVFARELEQRARQLGDEDIFDELDTATQSDADTRARAETETDVETAQAFGEGAQQTTAATGAVAGGAQAVQTAAFGLLQGQGQTSQAGTMTETQGDLLAPPQLDQVTLEDFQFDQPGQPTQPETTTETTLDLDLDLRTGTPADTDTPPREAEAESELTRSDIDILLDDDTKKDGRQVAGGEFTKAFEFGVASADSILSGEATDTNTDIDFFNEIDL